MSRYSEFMAVEELPRDLLGHVLAADGQPVRWAYCIYCGLPLTSWWSQTEGFGNTCYVKLDRDERQRLYDAAVQSWLLELGYPPGLNLRDRWRNRLRLIRMH